MFRQLAFLLFILFTQAIYANWKTNFYTDDSPYYQQVTKDGFSQIIRVHENYCHDLKSIRIEFQNSKIFPFEKLHQSPMNLYGLDTSDFCWYKATVRDLNLNEPQKNKFVIVLEDSQNTFFLGEIKDSILPAKRLMTSKTDIAWMTPGTQGANLVLGGGVLFKVWGPNAQLVELYINKGQNKINMQSDSDQLNPLQNHIAYVSNANEKTTYHYQFVVNGEYEKVEIDEQHHQTAIKIDPMAREITYQCKGALINNYKDVYGVVSQIPKFNWEFDHYIKSFTSISKNNNWIIYQLWPLTFNPHITNDGPLSGTFQSIIEKIDYLSGLGINAVELLPINEFRFDVSWGYMLDSLRLIEKTYGSPKELMNLSDKLHQRGIKLVLDIVLNHVNNTLIRDPLSPTNFSTKYYNGDTGWGPKPRFESPMVKKWIIDSLIGLIRDYHIDGFRFDMIKYIYQDNDKAYLFLQELTQLLKIINPEIHLMAEELPDNVWTTYPVSEKGLGFDSQWNDNFKNFFEKDLDEYKNDHRLFDAGKLVGALHGYSNHENFKFGLPERTVNYLGSHDFIGNRDPIIRVVSDYYATERVGNETFFRVKPLSDNIDLPRKFKLIHNDFTHSFIKLAYGILFTKPGNILFFQGEELASDINIQNEWSYIKAVNNIPTQDIDRRRYISDHKMLWEYLDPKSYSELHFLNDTEVKLFKGHHQFIKDMISFRNNYPGIGSFDVFNLRTSHNGSVITYQLKSEDNDFFIILNFGNDMNAAWITFPGSSTTWWREVINSSVEEYGGSSSLYTNVIDQLGERNNLVRLQGPSIIIFKKIPRPQINVQLYFMSDLGNWISHESFKLLQSQEDFVYELKLAIPTDGVYEFKLATHNWSIELGSANEHTYYSLDYGQFDYQPFKPNVKVLLEKGNYSFTFNIRTFGYTFKKK